MGPKIQALLDFQDVEHQIVDIRRQFERKQRAVDAQQKKLDSFRATLDAERFEINKIQRQFDELDLDVKSRDVQISKLREHLSSIRTNKEYAAVLSQLNNEKADSSRQETKALEIMEQLDARRRAFNERAAGEGAERDRLAALVAELELTRRNFADRLDSLIAQREKLAAAIDPKHVELFNRLSGRHEGEVMAEVVRPNPRLDEFICGGCNISLRMDAANSVRTKDEPNTCKNCGRILYARV
jgi:uncharacterized protein